MIAGPYLAGGAALAIMASAIGGFFVGKDAGADGVRSDLLKKVAAETKAKDEAERKLGDLTLELVTRDQTRQTTVREIYRETAKVVQNPVYRNVCIDADGVQLLERAAAAANGESAPAPSGGPAEAADAASEPEPERRAIAGPDE